jgi:DNA polymerase III subunit epsilon
MKPERQFWLWVLALCVGLVALLGAQAALFYLQHRGALALLPRDARANLLVFLGLALLSMLPFLVLGMRVWFRRYVLPLHRLGEDVESLLYGSPDARVVVREDDPAGLAPLLNALMERYSQGEQGVQARLDAARGELSAESSRLESVLEALREGVLAFSLQGRILRFNRAARALLGDPPALGTGRPVQALLEAPVLDFAREAVQGQLATGVAGPHASFTLRTADGAERRATISPLLVYGGRLEGFVLVIAPAEPGAPPAGAPDAPRPAAPTGAPSAPGATPVDWHERPLRELRYVVFDTETTGLNPAQGDAVISLAAVVVADGALVPGERFSERVDPRRPISPAARRVHGISAEDVAGRPLLAEVLPAFVRLAAGSVLVAHNAAFDMAFLRPAAAAAGLPLEQPVLDTMLLSAVVHPHQPSHSLDSLIARYGIAQQARHDALGDACMTAELLLRLLPQLERRGITTLHAALEQSRRTPLAQISYGA